MVSHITAVILTVTIIFGILLQQYGASGDGDEWDYPETGESDNRGVDDGWGEQRRDTRSFLGTALKNKNRHKSKINGVGW